MVPVSIVVTGVGSSTSSDGQVNKAGDLFGNSTEYGFISVGTDTEFVSFGFDFCANTTGNLGAKHAWKTARYSTK